MFYYEDVVLHCFVSLLFCCGAKFIHSNFWTNFRTMKRVCGALLTLFPLPLAAVSLPEVDRRGWRGWPGLVWPGGGGLWLVGRLVGRLPKLTAAYSCADAIRVGLVPPGGGAGGGRQLLPRTGSSRSAKGCTLHAARCTLHAAIKIRLHFQR